jgi:hypothetical protein
VPREAGVGTPPDDRPGGIPGDLGRVASIKSTTDIERGYSATWRGEILTKQRKGLTLVKPERQSVLRHEPLRGSAQDDNSDD